MSDATEIVTNLWMGGQWEPILDTEFGAVVNLRILEDVYLGISDGWLDQEGPASLWIPLIDEPIAPPKWKVLAAVAFVYTAIQNGVKTLVHCEEGHNRSGLIVAAYLKMFMTTDEAIALVRQKRPGALSNETFCKMLEGL